MGMKQNEEKNKKNNTLDSHGGHQPDFPVSTVVDDTYILKDKEGGNGQSIWSAYRMDVQ